MESPREKTILYKLEQSLKLFLLYCVQQCFTVFLFISKIFMIPILYPVCWGLAIVVYLASLGKLVLTFLMNGIKGVLQSIAKLSFSDKLHYAILKQNGMYLKLSRYSIEDAFTCQLYDYSIRKFMTVTNMDEDIKVGQIQPWSHTGLKYLKRQLKLKRISVFHNSPEKIQKMKSKITNLDYVSTDYSQQTQKKPQDVFIMFNRNKDKDAYKNYVDVIKIMSYIRRNLCDHGYAILGNCFTSEGQITVFEQLVEGFGFKISAKQNVTKNILHAQKILSKTYQNRKVAWAKQKLKQFIKYSITGDHCVGIFLTNLWHKLEKLTGVKYGPSQYIIYIVELNL